MYILTCFKVVPDLDKLSGSSWTIDDQLNIETAFVSKMINPYDESALEIALQLSDQITTSGTTAELSAITIGNSQADLYLKSLRALGYKKACRINCSIDLRFNPEYIAALIGAYVKQNNPCDLILMGRQSGEGDNAKTPFITAEIIGWPCIADVLKVDYISPKLISVTNLTDNGILRQTVKLPCLLTVGNAPNSHLRVPTLKAIKTVGNEPARVIEDKNLIKFVKPGQKINGAKLLGLELIDHTRQGIIIEGNSAEEKALLLYNNYLKGWLADNGL
ncbi:MAG: electron transfer flavoprotein subunit beta/FixA family protein [Dethiobacteria bacterium]